MTISAEKTSILKIIGIYLMALFLVSFSFKSNAAEGNKKKMTKTNEGKTKKEGKNMIAVFDTSMGTFKVKLYSDWSPKTVENFVSLAEGTNKNEKLDKKYAGKKFYDGLIFHRIIDGFMIQGGDPLGNGMGGPGYKFANEDHPNAKHSKAGILAMANAGRDTNGSQFYITVAPQPRLDGGYTVFGEVSEGLDVVMKISKVETGPMDKPLKPVVINSVTIEKH